MHVRPSGWDILFASERWSDGGWSESLVAEAT